MSASDAARLLQGQTALVVNANAGIGAAVAEALAAAGAKVMVHYLHESKAADQVAQRIRAKQGQAMIFQTDISRESQVKSLFDVLAAYWGGLDILVTNANLEIDDPAGPINPEQWREIFVQNLTGQFLCVRQAMREFLRQGCLAQSANSAGNIICLSSLREVLNPNGPVKYSVCKPNMSSLLQAFATEPDQDHINIDLCSASAKLVSYNRQDIASAAVGLAAGACAGLLAMDEFGQIRIGSESDMFE
jgi:NAD(P)-dependent dehydrogenase (short-subunit alcohol dehydrogenase family)